MADFANNGFEVEGGRVGDAQAWRVRSKASAFELAGYHANTFDPLISTSLDVILDWNQRYLTANPAVGPDPVGGMNAYELIEDGTNHAHLLHSMNLLSFKRGRSYTIGAWLKPAAVDACLFAGVGVYHTTSGAGCIADLLTGEITSNVNTAVALTSSSARVHVDAPANNDWMRVEFSFTPSADYDGWPMLFLSSDGTQMIYLGTGKIAWAWMPYVFEGALLAADDFGGSGWMVHFDFVLEPTDVELAAYATAFVNTAAFESFETGWQNFPFLYETATSENAIYNFTEAVDAFELGWMLGPFLLTLGPGDIEENTETFETGWIDPPYAYDLDGVGDTDLAVYNGGVGAPNSEFVEDFEYVIPDVEVSIDPATDVFSANAHPLQNTDDVYLKNLTGTIAGGFQATLLYFVRDRLANSFKLALSSGGAAVDALTAGTGRQIVRGNPVSWWSGDDVL